MSQSPKARHLEGAGAQRGAVVAARVQRELCDGLAWQLLGLGQRWGMRLPACLWGSLKVRRGLSREGLRGKHGVFWAGVGEVAPTATGTWKPLVPALLKQPKGGSACG